MIDIDYDKEENVIRAKRRGIIELQDMLEYITKLDNDFQGLERLNIIEDTRDSEINFNDHDFPLIIKEIRSRIGKYKEVRTAVLVEDPRETALNLIYEMISDFIPNYTFKTFCTENAAIYWLKQY